jgi:Zn-dependent protease
MFRSWLIGRPLGVELRLHGTLLLLAAIFVLARLLSSGLGAAVATAVVLAIVFGSVALHELGHIVAARRFGIGTSGITLYPFGGLARLTRESRTPTEELVVALGGPAVNVLLAGLGGALMLVFGSGPLLASFVWINVVLLLFNLVPAYPMDGGRVLRAALWRWKGRRLATRWAARAGQGFSVLFAAAAIAWGEPLLLLVAAVVFLMASGELARARLASFGGLGRGPGIPPGWVQPDRPGVTIYPPGSRAPIDPSGGGEPRPRPQSPFGAPRVMHVRTPWGTWLRIDS